MATATATAAAAARRPYQRQGATDVVQGASAIVLSSPAPSVIMEAIVFAQEVLSRAKNCAIYHVAFTPHLF